MQAWELLLYLVLIGIVLYILYKIGYNFVISSEYKQTLEYLKIERNATSIRGFFGEVPIYYINLDRSHKRRKNIEDAAIKYEITNLHRIQAVDGKNITIPYQVRGYRKYTNSELACTLSHIKAIKEAYHNGDELAIILEDDTGFGLLSKSTLKLTDIIELAPKDWEYINLCPLNPFLSIVSLDENFASNHTMNGFGTSCYVINRKGMKNVLDKIGNNVLDQRLCASDYLFSDVILPKITRSYNYIGQVLFYQNKTFPKEVDFSFKP